MCVCVYVCMCLCAAADLHVQCSADLRPQATGRRLLCTPSTSLRAATEEAPLPFSSIHCRGLKESVLSWQLTNDSLPPPMHLINTSTTLPYCPLSRSLSISLSLSLSLPLYRFFNVSLNLLICAFVLTSNLSFHRSCVVFRSLRVSSLSSSASPHLRLSCAAAVHLLSSTLCVASSLLAFSSFSSLSSNLLSPSHLISVSATLASWLGY